MVRSMRTDLEIETPLPLSFQKGVREQGAERYSLLIYYLCPAARFGGATNYKIDARSLFSDLANFPSPSSFPSNSAQ